MIVTSLDALAIARVTARKSRTADLTRTVRERYGIDLPVGPRRARSGDLAFIGIGVNTWLATSDKELDGFAKAVRDVGATLLIAGNAVFADPDPGAAYARIRTAAA